MIKTRYLESEIEKLCFDEGKMAFISGPRQCGKTTMAKHLLQMRGFGKYYNWDELKFRKIWTKNPSQIITDNSANTKKPKPIIVLDEIHKAKLWKRNLKGVYDTLEFPCDILVTGSARLNVYRKGSDSLLGRYRHFRLHPFSLAELDSKSKSVTPENLIDFLFNGKFNISKDSESNFKLLDEFSGFPEPLFKASKKNLFLWHRERIEKIIREDLRDLSHLPELSQIEMLVSLLPERAANILSIQSLAEDLEVAYTTVKRWLCYMYQLYYAFTIQPYTKSLSRSLKKNAKMYLWDWSEIENEAARFENLIACHLLKYCDFLTQTGIGDFQLYYLRNREKQEIDFLIAKNKNPWLPIEVKLNSDVLSENWPYFMKHLPCKYGIQVVKSENVNILKETLFGKILILSATNFLSCLI